MSDGETVRATPDEAGDEPVWLARRLPGVRVVVAAKRAEAAQTAMELGADLVLLDDGFSHHALARTADVLAIDDDLRFGNRRLLPAGPLREPVSSVDRASLLWLTKARDPAATLGLDRPLVRTSYEPEGLSTIALVNAEPLSWLSGKRILATCGIARPESFERSLAALGANVRRIVAFPDHHRFTVDDVARLDQLAREERCDAILTTEKDAVRLALTPPTTLVRALRMEVRVIGDASALDAFIRRFAPGAA